MTVTPKEISKVRHDQLIMPKSDVGDANRASGPNSYTGSIMAFLLLNDKS